MLRMLPTELVAAKGSFHYFAIVCVDGELCGSEVSDDEPGLFVTQLCQSQPRLLEP